MAKYAITYHTDLKTESEAVSTIMKILSKDISDVSGEDIRMALSTLLIGLDHVLTSQSSLKLKMDQYYWDHIKANLSDSIDNIDSKLKEMFNE